MVKRKRVNSRSERSTQEARDTKTGSESSTQEAPEGNTESRSRNGTHETPEENIESGSDCEDSECDTEDEGEEEGSEVDTDQLAESSEDSYEEDSEGDPGEAEQKQWTSKDGKTVWSPTNAETYRFIPAATGLVPGPTRYASARITDLASCFSLLLTDEILQHIVDKTNPHGKRLTSDWRDVDTDEMRAYVGLLVLASVYRSRNEPTNSLWSEKTGRGIFSATMSHKRFQQLNRTIQFDDRQSRDQRRRDDKIAAFRKVWTMWTCRLPLMLNPDKDICVDAQLVPFKGKCSFRQYIPTRTGKYGIKVWTTCDVKTSYVWRLQVYTGTSAPKPDVSQRVHVILEMIEGLIKGHTLTCDHFFTSLPLAEELLKRKMTLVGPISRSRPELPRKLLWVQARAALSSTFAFARTHTLVSYMARRRKNVLLLSTKHRSPDLCSGVKKKPVIFRDYKKCKEGVDALDKVINTYTCRRKTRRWPLALFLKLIDISLHNAFVLWTSTEPSWMKQKSHRRRLFIEEVGEMLVTPHIQKRRHLPRSSAAAQIVTELKSAAEDGSSISKSKRRRKCELCTAKKRVERTCYKCDMFVCKDHCQAICIPCSK